MYKQMSYPYFMPFRVLRCW